MRGGGGSAHCPRGPHCSRRRDFWCPRNAKLSPRLGGPLLLLERGPASLTRRGSSGLRCCTVQSRDVPGLGCFDRLLPLHLFGRRSARSTRCRRLGLRPGPAEPRCRGCGFTCTHAPGARVFVDGAYCPPGYCRSSGESPQHWPLVLWSWPGSPRRRSGRRGFSPLARCLGLAFCRGLAGYLSRGGVS